MNNMHVCILVKISELVELRERVVTKVRAEFETRGNIIWKFEVTNSQESERYFGKTETTVSAICFARTRERVYTACRFYHVEISTAQLPPFSPVRLDRKIVFLRCRYFDTLWRKRGHLNVSLERRFPGK